MFRNRFNPFGLRTSAAVCLSAITLLALLSLSGCGGSSNPVSVTVTSSAATVDATDSVTVTAAVMNDKTPPQGVTWTVTGGGTLSNSSTTGATYTAPAASSSALTVTVTATSVADTTKTGTTTLTVPAKPTITTATLPAGSVGAAYTVTLAGSGGIAPYKWTLTAGTLPTAWTLTSAGVLSGPAPVAGQVGATNLTFELTDSGTATALTVTQQLTLTINPAVAIAFTGSVPATATWNVAYSGSAAAGGGAGALTYSIASGAMPTGLSLNAATGAITGTPTAVGTFNFTIQAADAFGDANTQAYSIKVSYPALAVTAATLPTGYVGSTYTTKTLTATGGTGTGYTWALATGSALPAGMNLSAAGVISGKPTATTPTSFTVTVTDSASNTANGTFSITVDAAVSITTATTLPTAYVGSNYSQTLVATGGSGTGYTWALASGSNPPAGLNLSATGVLSGKPTTAGTPNFAVIVTDSVGNTATATFTVTISAGETINPATLPVGYPGTVYTPTTLTATGGTGTGFTWTWAAATGSTLPAGLSISTTGIITGTPINATTASLVSNVVVTVTDSVGNTATANFSVTIEATLAISSGVTLPGGVLATAYSDTLAATGGSGGNIWSTNVAGTTSLAAIGLSLSSAGVVSGASPTLGTATFTGTVTDSASHTANLLFSVTVSNALTITTNSLPAAYSGTLYSQTLAAAGGTGTGYKWTATSSNLATFNLTLTNGGLLSGTPATSGTASFTATVTDSASNTATQALTVTVYAALTLPTTNPNTLPSATINQSYSGSINVTGGVPPYTWTVTGLPSDGLSSSSSGGTLSISGTPTATGTVTFTASVTDSASHTTGTNTYTIAVNSAGSQVSGQIGLGNNCGGVNVPTITLNLYAGSATSGTPVQTVTTSDSQGDYSFSTVPSGSYTIVPSITGPSSVFYPASQSVSVTSGNPNPANFTASLGYIVSGTVSYSGTQTGQVYLNLNNNSCGGNGGPGTSITEATLTGGGAFTIRGVPPGSYTLDANMDNLGQGQPNATNPTNSGTQPTPQVSNANVTGVAVTLADPTVTAPSSAPTLNAITPNEGGVVISFKAITSNGEEAVTSYTVQWSTSSTFTGTPSSWTFKAVGTHSNVWILNNSVAGPGSFVSGTAYYFRARGVNSAGDGGFQVYGGGTPTGVTILTSAIPSGYNTVTGAVSIPAGITPTGPLYVGFYNQSNNDVYATIIPLGSISTSSPNSYTVYVPTDSSPDYINFAILDQNNDGLIDVGDVSNTDNNGGSSGIAITPTGTLTGYDPVLPGADSTLAVTTQYQQDTSYNGSGPSTQVDYSLNFNLRKGNKLPVSVTLTSGPNVIYPVDLSACNSCGTQQFQYSVYLNSVEPVVGQAYGFLVTYSDGSTDPNVTAAVTGWNGTGTLVGASDLATDLQPSESDSTSLTPTFTWTYPTANASDFIYSFYLSGPNGTIWQIPSNNSNFNGFTSAQVPMPAGITWGTDPIESVNPPSVTDLTSGDNYQWQIQVQDSAGNQALTTVYYVP